MHTTCIDDNETTLKGRGRGRPRKVVAPLYTKGYGRVSEFSLVSPATSKMHAEPTSDQLKTDVTPLNPEASPSDLPTAKRSVSKRANRGINPKYDSEIYLGLSGSNVPTQGEVCENPSTKPFTLTAEPLKREPARKRRTQPQPNNASLCDS